MTTRETYAQVPRGYVGRNFMRRLSLHAKLVMLALDTSERGGALPAVEVRGVCIAEDLGLSLDDVVAALEELQRAGEISYDPESRVALLHRQLQNAPPVGDKSVISARRGFYSLGFDERSAAFAARVFATVAETLSTETMTKPDKNGKTHEKDSDRDTFLRDPPAWLSKALAQTRNDAPSHAPSHGASHAPSHGASANSQASAEEAKAKEPPPTRAAAAAVGLSTSDETEIRSALEALPDGPPESIDVFARKLLDEVRDRPADAPRSGLADAIKAAHAATDANRRSADPATSPVGYFRVAFRKLLDPAELAKRREGAKASGSGIDHDFERKRRRELDERMEATRRANRERDEQIAREREARKAPIAPPVASIIDRVMRKTGTDGGTS